MNFHSFFIAVNKKILYSKKIHQMCGEFSPKYKILEWFSQHPYAPNNPTRQSLNLFYYIKGLCTWLLPPQHIVVMSKWNIVWCTCFFRRSYSRICLLATNDFLTRNRGRKKCLLNQAIKKLAVRPGSPPVEAECKFSKVFGEIIHIATDYMLWLQESSA